MMYKTPGMSVGLSTVLIAVGMIYALKTILTSNRRINMPMISLIAIYILWVMAKSTGQGILLCIAIIIHLAAISTGAINLDYLRKLLENISLIAAICLISQQIYHVLIGGNLVFMNTDWFLPMMESYVEKVNTGFSYTNNMYRPSAFFLEPSHYTCYTIYGLGSFLFREKEDFKKAIITTIGLFASTSGFGFVLAFAIWGWWYLIHRTGSTITKMLPKIIGIGIAMYLVYLVLLQVPFFAEIINRFTNSDDSTYNAINGRLFWWDTFFGDKSISYFLFGQGEESLPEVYFTGFMKIIFAYGVVGMLLYSCFLIYLLKKSNNYAKTYVIIYIALLFFANQTGFINIIFHIGCIITFMFSKDIKDVKLTQA